MPPPVNCLEDAEVKLIVPVPVTVVFAGTPTFQTVLLPANVQVPEPTAIVLDVAEFPKNAAEAPVIEKLDVAALKVPEKTVKLLLVEKASCNVTEPPGVVMANGCGNVFPALVIV